MKAAYIEQVRPPQVIQYGELPMPTVGRKEDRIFAMQFAWKTHNVTGIPGSTARM